MINVNQQPPSPVYVACCMDETYPVIQTLAASREKRRWSTWNFPHFKKKKKKKLN